MLAFFTEAQMAALRRQIACLSAFKHFLKIPNAAIWIDMEECASNKKDPDLYSMIDTSSHFNTHSVLINVICVVMDCTRRCILIC